MKEKYIAHYGDGDIETFETIEEARAWLIECSKLGGDGEWSEDAEGSFISVMVEVAKLVEVDNIKNHMCPYLDDCVCEEMENRCKTCDGPVEPWAYSADWESVSNLVFVEVE